MSAVTRTAEARMRLVRALVRQKSTAAAAAGKPIAHIYPNSETPVKALDPCGAASRSNNSCAARARTVAALHVACRKRKAARLDARESRLPSRLSQKLTDPAARRRAVDADQLAALRVETRAREDAKITLTKTQARHLRAPPPWAPPSDEAGSMWRC